MQALFVAAVTLASISCTQEPTNPDTRPALAEAVQPLCQLGCQEQDPYPLAPGYFLTSSYSEDMCLDYGNDVDYDGLRDECEQLLAQTFAPELYYSSSDNVGRETHWAAMPTVYHDAPAVRIAYLLSYHRDEGSSAWLCHLPPPFNDSSCYGHNGDGEWIALDVRFNWNTQHWVLAEAVYSAHEGFDLYDAGTDAFPAYLSYPQKPGGYPRSYVSEGKHANYASAADCNSGGEFGTDTCEHLNSTVRVSASSFLNIGSRAHHTSAQDCMTSSDLTFEYYGYGAVDCYWTILGGGTGYFAGWYPLSVGGAISTPGYTTHLALLGF